MYDLFKRRMERLSPNGTVGACVVRKTNDIENKTFSNDQNYQHGMLYDWDMNPLEEVDFKFEKHKTFKAEGAEVEYHIHFRPDYNPEYLFKDRYFKKDGKERYGFYIDVLDNSKGITEKWLIVGKDNRVAFDRYNAFRCNWYYEWIYKDEYHKCLGVVREANDSTFNSSDIDKLGGTSVSGELSLIVPTSENTMTILVGQKFIVSDNLLNPQTYEVDKIKDYAPLGIVRAFLKQRAFDPHTDYFGIINEEERISFKFDVPIDDLPEEFGGQYHMICDCILSKENGNNSVEDETTLECDVSILYVKGRPAIIRTGVISEDVTWHYYIDGEEFSYDDIQEYFLFEYENQSLKVTAISQVMNKYTLGIELETPSGSRSNIIELEVSL